MRLPRFFGVLVVATALIPVHAAAALPFPVDSLANSGTGSLRAAIAAANANPGEDTIPISATGTIGLTAELPPITGSVAITGPGASSLTVERVAATQFGIFAFTSGITSSISGLTVSGGLWTEGGGIFNENSSLTLTRVVVEDNEAVNTGGSDVGATGGGILSVGPLTVRESVIRDNVARAIGGTNLNFAVGGGINAFGALTVDRSTISGNIVEALGGDSNTVTALGGGLRALGDSTVERSTISDNSALAVEGATSNGAIGGGIQGVKMTLTSSTVTGNSLQSDDTAEGANIQLDSPETLISNTIVSRPIGAASCSKPHGSGGFNLDEDGSCDFGHGSDLANVAAGLEPILRLNGGATPTHALLENSAAVDRGNSFGSTLDQRGLPRPVDLATRSNSEGGDGADIGAVELQTLPSGDKPAPSPILVGPIASDRTAPNTRIITGPPRVTFGQLATFRFNSTESQSHFQCKIDSRRWRGCRSPLRWKVSAGRKHLFKVRAIDRFGNVDRTPARFGWRVKRVGG